jgi:hypothetical protein
MRVPRFSFGRCLTIAAVAGLWVAGCQNPDAFYRGDGGIIMGSGKGGSGPGAGGTGAPTGAGGFIGLGGQGGSLTSGAGGLIIMNNGGTTGKGGAAGSADAGTDAPLPPCTTCAVKVHYTCRDSGTNQMSFVLRVENMKSNTINLSDLTVRYWFTTDDPTGMVFYCDYAMLDCANVTPNATFAPVTPRKTGANAYLQVGFGASAAPLTAFSDTGDIQIRVSDSPSYYPVDQTDDYSYDCSMMNTEVDNMKITAYVGGALAWGVEPM